MARIVKKSPAGATQVFILNLGVNRLGSDPETDVWIQHQSVAKHHCDLILTLEAVLLHDRHSARGTFVDGKRIKRAILRAGQVIKVGDVQIEVEDTEVRVAIPAANVATSKTSASKAKKPSEIFQCPRHPTAEVKFRCPSCRAILSDGCVRKMRRTGGKTLLLCSLCGRHAENLWL